MFISAKNKHTLFLFYVTVLFCCLSYSFVLLLCFSACLTILFYRFVLLLVLLFSSSPCSVCCFIDCSVCGFILFVNFLIAVSFIDCFNSCIAYFFAFLFHWPLCFIRCFAIGYFALLKFSTSSSISVSRQSTFP